MNSKKLLVGAIAFISVYAFAADDISGIKVGLPLSSQFELLSKINPNYKFESIKEGNGKVVGVTALAKNDTFVIIKNDLGNVWFVGRSQEYDSGERIKFETLISSLNEKYGKPSLHSDYGTRWLFDRDGNLYKGSVEKSPCYKNISNIQVSGIPVPTVFLEGCGRQITMYPGSTADGMISKFTLTIADHKSMYDEINNRNNSIEAERKKALEEEKEKNNKPNL